jgi:hypothetical protein
MVVRYRSAAVLAAWVCLVVCALSTQPAQAAPWRSGCLPVLHSGACAAQPAPCTCSDTGVGAPVFSADGAGPAAVSDIPLLCYLDYILALENFVQGFILLAYYLRDPTDVVTLIVAGLTFSVAMSRYFDYLECLIDE